MRIHIEINLDYKTREVYGFNLFDLTAVLVTYHVEEKPTGKRKWQITSFWDTYNLRHATLQTPPELTEEIKALVLAKIQEYIKIKTWAEYKS